MPYHSYGAVFVFTVSYVLSLVEPGTEYDFFVHVSFYGIVLIFYLCCWLLPYKWLYRRPALIGYAIFWSVTRGIVVVSEILEYLKIDVGTCFETVGFDLMFTMAIPFVAYNTEARFTVLARYPNGRMDCWKNEWITRTASGNIPCGAILHRKLLKVWILYDLMAKVETLNFAYLNIPEGSILGHGGSSRVYKGKYKGNDVAVKMLFCIDLTKEVIRRFFNEIKIHSGLRHSTVVKVQGVCIIPPAICLVMECMDCSLYECLHSAEGQKFKMNQRLKIAIECAKAVAFLHTSKPYVLHGDVKSIKISLYITQMTSTK